jgi:hypothetical protein
LEDDVRVDQLQGENMVKQTKKMSEMMKEMSEQLLRNPDAAHSPEAAHVALMFANIAWNKTVGLGHPRNRYRSAWEMIKPRILKCGASSSRMTWTP